MVNKDYLIGSDHWMSPYQYAAYIDKSDHAYEETSIVYFKSLPDWTINIVYCAYLIAFIVVISGKQPAFKIPRINIRTSAIVGVCIVVVGVICIAFTYKYNEAKSLESQKDALVKDVKSLKEENNTLKKQVSVKESSHSPERQYVTDPELLKKLNGATK